MDFSLHSHYLQTAVYGFGFLGYSLFLVGMVLFRTLPPQVCSHSSVPCIPGPLLPFCLIWVLGSTYHHTASTTGTPVDYTPTFRQFMQLPTIAYSCTCYFYGTTPRTTATAIAACITCITHSGCLPTCVHLAATCRRPACFCLPAACHSARLFYHTYHFVLFLFVVSRPATCTGPAGVFLRLLPLTTILHKVSIAIGYHFCSLPLTTCWPFIFCHYTSTDIFLTIPVVSLLPFQPLPQYYHSLLPLHCAHFCSHCCLYDHLPHCHGHYTCHGDLHCF